MQALRWTAFSYDPYSGATLEKQVHKGSRVTKITWTHSELVAGRRDTGQLVLEAVPGSVVFHLAGLMGRRSTTMTGNFSGRIG